MQKHTAHINDLEINYYESEGKGSPIFLAHGNSVSGLSFTHQLDGSLGKKHRVIAIDLPGHGLSARAKDLSGYALPGYADVLVGLAEKLDVGNAVFVGWSLGGHIVLEASPRLPKAAGFAIFGTPPLAFPPDMGNAYLPHPAMAAAFNEKLSDAEMDAYINAFFVPGTEGSPQAFRDDVRRTDGRARAGLAASIKPDGYLDEVMVVTTMTNPLAILQGAQEQLVNGAYISAIKMPALWRGALQIVPNAGHAPQWEQPEKFNALIEEFARDCSGKS